jgi:diaminohydroxyphosphoribosylaminopyrimidine deaminase/5-amino-6-(5-phosphoribosylamino)uracil reductase
MRAALALARRGLGMVWPNPSVGCVIVRDGRVVGRGVTAFGGRPHAEAIALATAGEQARGATVYVTLEPCCHWGRSPPCTEALITAGIARAVIATGDPDPRVNGQGLTRLRAAGVSVSTGLLEAEARDVLFGFSQRMTLGRPMVTLKLATTLDGRIATQRGESQWITGTAARRVAHALRGRHDAVMVGVGTVLADNPELTCRIPGYRPTPVVRVVADSHLRTPLTARLAATARSPPGS